MDWGVASGRRRQRPEGNSRANIIYVPSDPTSHSRSINTHKIYLHMANQQYKQANIDWLQAKSKEEGVMSLAKGIFYKVLSEGRNDGLHPSPRSIVTVHYTGKTIDGRTFDTSRDSTPPAFRLSDLIEGWIIALQQMCVGDVWEIYLPANMGYGNYSQPGIPANSTLIFEIELVGIA